MCPDEAALLRAVAAAPVDDLPRLVLADWLDEHGGRPARAEFIRLQVDRAAGRGSAGDRSRGLRRALALYREHGAGWLLADWPEAAGLPNAYTFDRGFVTDVTLAADRVDEPGFVRLVADRPLLALVRKLAVEANGVGDAGLRALAGCPRVAGLTHLDLTGNTVTDAGLEALAASPHLGRLAELTLGWPAPEVEVPPGGFPAGGGEQELGAWLGAHQAALAAVRHRRGRVEALFRRHGKAVRVDPGFADPPD